MSYYHCSKHDQESTNGCGACEAEHVERLALELDDPRVIRELRAVPGAQMFPRRHTIVLLRLLKERGFTVIHDRTGLDMTQALL